MRTRLPFFLLLLILFGCKSGKLPGSEEPTPIPVSIFHVNDVYEIGALGGGSSGGMARVATLIKELEASNPNIISILAGDFLNPSVMGLAKIDGERVRGRQMVDMMNQVGIDWVVFGNHEFDLPYPDLQKRINESEFGWIGGNVRQVVDGKHQAFAKEVDGSREELPRSTIWEIPVPSGQPIKIGILGVCLDFNQPDYVHYEDVFESAAEDFAQLSQETDFVIAITHLEIAQDRELAKQLPGLKLIMGGHDHTNMREKVGNVIITKADANAKTAYVHNLQVDPTSRKVSISSTLRALDESVIPDSEIAAKVKAWEDKAYASFSDLGLSVNDSITTLPEPLDGLESHIRYQPTNLGKALTQSMFEASEGVACALTNSGGIRVDDYLQGTITFFDLIRTMPYGGEVWVVEMNGSLLARVLDVGESNKGLGGYLQTWNVTGSKGDWQVAEQPIVDETVYQVAITDFLMSGRESNLGFLTESNPDIRSIAKPGPTDNRRDVRLVLADYLRNAYK